MNILFTIFISSFLQTCSLPESLDEINYTTEVYRERYSNRILETHTLKYKGITYELDTLEGDIMQCRYNGHIWQRCGKLQYAVNPGPRLKPLYCSIPTKPYIK